MTTTLALTEQQAAELQARAVKRTWAGPSLCINEEAASGELPAALAQLYEEVLYVEVPNSVPSVGWERCTLVWPGPVKWYRPDVVGVDVWILSGFLVGRTETHLFRWNGAAWIDATPEETGVTVTTLIS